MEGCLLALPLAASAQVNYANPYLFTTFAGSGSTGSANGPGTSASFGWPEGEAVDAMGNLYLADTWSNTVRKVTPTGVVTTLAGKAGSAGNTDGPGGLAQFNNPEAVAVDSLGNVYVADTFNNTIRKVTTAGVVTTLIGKAGLAGNADGAPTAARLNSPEGVAVDGAGNVYVADTFNNTVRKLTPHGMVTTLAGKAGIAGSADGPLGVAQFNSPTGVVVDPAGILYVADTGNNTIRRVSAAGLVTTLAGLVSPVYDGCADGKGRAARFDNPEGLALDSQGNLYIADTANNTIREMNLAGMVTTLGGQPTVSGNADGTGSTALFWSPYGVAVDRGGNLYVADSDNFVIRKGVPARNHPSAPLVVQISGLGTVNPSLNDKVLAPGVNYTVTALPGRDWIFANWVGGTSLPYTVLSTQATYTFTMQTNLVLQANFITNIFLSARGSYNGLFYGRVDGEPSISDETAGMIRGLTIGADGAFSGKLLLNGASYTLRGAFDANGQTSVSVPLAIEEAGNLNVSMDLSNLWNNNVAVRGIQGQVAVSPWYYFPPIPIPTNSPIPLVLPGPVPVGGWTSSLFLFASTTNRTSEEYTLLLPPGTNQTGLPPGTGYMVITNHEGTLRLVGALADGTSIFQSVPMNAAGFAPLYFNLHTNTALLLGWANLNANASDAGNFESEVSGGTNLTWIKKASDGLFPDGFTNNVVPNHSVWTNQPMLSLAGSQLEISEGPLGTKSLIFTNLELGTSHILRGTTASGLKVKGRYNPKMGLLAITFENGNGNKTSAGVAALLQRANGAAGYGFFTTATNAGSISLVRTSRGQLLSDDFTVDSSLNTALWATPSGFLSELAAGSSSPGSTLLNPVLSFGLDGMQMAGVNGNYQFAGIQSLVAIAPPFTVNTTVMGTESYGNAFAVFLVNSSLSQWLDIHGDLNPATCYQNIWINHTASDIPFSSLGNPFYSNPSLGVFYTLQISVDVHGDASVLLLNASGVVLASQDGLSVGNGPFYLVLAQREGLPCVSGPLAATWRYVEAVSGE